VATGTIAWFDATKGYGFIRLGDDTRDAFVHRNDVEKAGLTCAALKEGTRISFDVVVTHGKVKARRLRLPR
jgi:cold shock protein